MRLARLGVFAVVFAVVAAGCGGGAEVTPTTSPSAWPSPSLTSTPTGPTAACNGDEVLSTIDAAIEIARLAPVTAWSIDVAGNRFAERTTTGDVFADRLGFDCGLVAAEDVGDADERLAIAAWTGPRMAWVVQTTETPTTPYDRDATVTVFVDETEGEYLDGETRALWAGTFASGETFVVGHVDFNLGAAAKGWPAELPPFDDETPALASERHAFEVLEAAGMREIGVAEPAELGSEEGHVQFVSPTGQISVADVAPAGWFDPLEPRYYTGATRFETIDGSRARVTEPGPDDNLGYAIAVEIGFACDVYVWILEPPFNGDADEMLATATAILATEECRPG